MLAVAAWWLSAAAPARPAQAPQASALLQAADALRRSFTEGVIHGVAMVTVDASQPSSEQQVDIYVQGDNHMLVVFLSGKQRGRRILVVDEKMWLIVPGASRAVPISARQQLLGAPSAMEIGRLDLARNYSATLQPAGDRIGDTECYVLALEARRPAVPFSTGVLWVGVEDGLPRRARLALPSGRPAQEITFERWGRLATGAVPSRITVRDLLRPEKGTTTTLELNRYESRPLDRALFTLQGARALATE